MGPSSYCRDNQGYFYHCDDSSWGSGNSWRRWYGEGGYSDLSRSLGRGQVTFAPSGGVQLTCDFSQTGRSDWDGMVTDIVWRKVDRTFRRTTGGRSFFTDSRYNGRGFSDRASFVNIGSVDAGVGDRFDGRYGSFGGYNGGRYSGFNRPGYYGYNTGSGGYYDNNYNGPYRDRGDGFYDGFGSSSMGSFSGGYVRDDYLGPANTGFGGRPGYDSGYYSSGFGSGCSGGGCGCGGRPWYRCLDSRVRRRRRHVSTGGRAMSCWVTQGPGWSTLTLTRPGPEDEGLYMCVGRSGGSRAVSMEVELSRYVAGGRYRSALLKTEPDRVVEEGAEGREEEEEEAAANEVEK
ncbi:loricrin-like [Amphibalanus amphitrite]|uniref:loricrin-like n=1 Tax=Amphibalanus amphitrite TaxID=1232801 RepID=UPI001C912336|nr:loricrin-like [Amphibalanus amphitrite]